MTGDQATHAEFGATSWTLIRAARRGEQWEALLRAYRDPIYGFFRRRVGLSPADAEDATSGFLVREIEKRSVVSGAVEGLRFRTYLAAALRNHWRDELRRRHGRHGERRFVDIERWDTPVEPGDAFEREWALATVRRAIQRVEASCAEMDQRDHWEAFRRRVVDPIVRGGPPPGVDAIAADLGHPPAQISSMIYTVKRKFRAALEEAVAETVDRPHEIGDELALVEQALSG